jgi:tetratricopeptide (TPR) repeat protein
MLRGTTRGTAGGLGVIAILAVATSALVSWKMRGDATDLRGPLANEIARGSLVGLGRAQAIGRRVIIAEPDDAESAALLAFTSALLATELGQGTINEAESAAARAEAAHGDPAKAGNVAAIAGAARALVSLRKGQLPDALARATAAAAAPGLPYPRVALGRVRAAMGDLVGASRALEAAMVEAPKFLPAHLVWAEVHIDLGDAAGAQAVLAPIVARAPEDIRARLLLEEASQALEAGPRDPKAAPRPLRTDLQPACGENGMLPPYVVAGCALALASRARFAGDRFAASAQARAASRALPDEPRMLARAAQLLAATGSIDRAEKLVARASELERPEAPALAWARLAVTLGHGRAATAPPGLRPADGTARVLAARASFAAGGAGALAATLDGFGADVVARDADLRLLRRLTVPAADHKAAPEPTYAASSTAPPGKPSAATATVEAYVDGVRARLDGDASLAAEKLSHALAGHGDACRAAGEYIAALRSLKRHADPSAFSLLKAENAGCVNLPAP